MSEILSAELRSWIEIPDESDFSLHNLPFGVFSPVPGASPRCGVAMGDHVLDLASIAVLLSGIDGLDAYRVFSQPALNEFMSCPRSVWTATRNRLIDLLKVGGCDNLQSNAELCKVALHERRNVQMHLPAVIGDYTDFYSSREHATRVGSMLRDPANALNPNWLHLPVLFLPELRPYASCCLHRPHAQTRPILSALQAMRPKPIQIGLPYS
jgi:fumarylacetoacetase